MITRETISTIIDSQKESYRPKGNTILREALHKIPRVDSFATVITGLRRCGKSTLLQQYMQQNVPDALSLNFEDIRLAGFEVTDFSRLYEEIINRGMKVLFFDELQLANGWEVFVHQLLREGFQVFVTGSNATLMGKETGTHLTGRHLSTELFPFSFEEFVALRGSEMNPASLSDYLETGGMPEYIKSGESMILNRLFDDILVRDIAVRQSVRDINVLRQISLYLLSNVGNLVSASKMTGMYGIKSATTFLDYFSFLKDSYLFDFIPMFDYSLKAQARNPRKIYAMDTGFVSRLTSSFTDDFGRRFENLIYLHLRRKYNDIFYFKEKGECDFVVTVKGKAFELVQACYQIDDLNFGREYNGLLAAMKFFDLRTGTIVTHSQSDRFETGGFTIRMVPAHEYLADKD